MSAASWALQQAVFTALTADAGVIALLGSPPRIYDDPPRDAALPYAVIGEANESDWSTKTDSGASLLFSVGHGVCRAAGFGFQEAASRSPARCALARMARRSRVPRVAQPSSTCVSNSAIYGREQRATASPAAPNSSSAPLSKS